MHCQARELSVDWYASLLGFEVVDVASGSLGEWRRDFSCRDLLMMGIYIVPYSVPWRWYHPHRKDSYGHFSQTMSRHAFWKMLCMIRVVRLQQFKVDLMKYSRRIWVTLRVRPLVSTEVIARQRRKGNRRLWWRPLILRGRKSIT